MTIVTGGKSPVHVHRESRLRKTWSVMTDTFWILALAVIALFAFFVALGAFSPGEVVGVSVAVAVLVALWIVHAMLQGHSAERDPAIVRARERRGF